MFGLPSLYIGALPTAIFATSLVAAQVLRGKMGGNTINPDFFFNIYEVASHKINITNLDNTIRDNFYYCAEVLQQFVDNSPGTAATISKMGICDGESPCTMNIDNQCITSDRIVILIPPKCLDGSITRNELKAILAHEFSHGELKHLDKTNAIARYMHVFATPIFLSQCTNVVNFTLRSVWSGTIDGKELKKITLLVCLASVVSYVTSAYSRKHEFEADKRSLRLSRNPQGLISAIDTIERMHHESLRSKIFHYTQSQELSDTALKYVLTTHKVFHSVIATHPTKAERQKAISRIEIIDVTDNTSLADPNNIRREKQGTMPPGKSIYNNKLPGKGFTMFIPANEVASFEQNQTVLRNKA